MSRLYDNWERLVMAVLKREQFRELCHKPYSFGSSDFGSTSRLNYSSLSDASFDFEDTEVDGFPNYSGTCVQFQYIAGMMSTDHLSLGKQAEANSLVFFEGSPFEFTLKELFKASCDVLGQNIRTFRSMFVVSLRNDVRLVVKRFELKGYSADRWNKLDKHIKLLGSIKNENVAQPRGYYMSKLELLAFFDYFPRGSLHQMLHGSEAENLCRLDWDARVKIAVGVAKGLAHLHSREVWHRDVKASNIFINSKDQACLRVCFSVDTLKSAYQSPEGVSSKGASDVYSYGVLLIELLSGRSPYTAYVDWARRMVREEWTALVFDMHILSDHRVKQEILEMLRIAFSCVEKEPVKRPNIDQVAAMLSQISIGPV